MYFPEIRVLVFLDFKHPPAKGSGGGGSAGWVPESFEGIARLLEVFESLTVSECFLRFPWVQIERFRKNSGSVSHVSDEGFWYWQTAWGLENSRFRRGSVANVDQSDTTLLLEIPHQSLFFRNHFEREKLWHVSISMILFTHTNLLGGGFKYFLFSPLFGEVPILTNIFQRGWNHQLVWHGFPQLDFRQPGLGVKRHSQSSVTSGAGRTLNVGRFQNFWYLGVYKKRIYVYLHIDIYIYIHIYIYMYTHNMGELEFFLMHLSYNVWRDSMIICIIWPDMLYCILLWQYKCTYGDPDITDTCVKWKWQVFYKFFGPSARFHPKVSWFFLFRYLAC